MVNCTAAEDPDSTIVVYGDYMDGIESIFFIEGGDLSAAKLVK
jgi:hypothetical protein